MKSKKDEPNEDLTVTVGSNIDPQIVANIMSRNFVVGTLNHLGIKLIDFTDDQQMEIVKEIIYLFANDKVCFETIFKAVRGRVESYKQLKLKMA